MATSGDFFMATDTMFVAYLVAVRPFFPGAAAVGPAKKRMADEQNVGR